jgi:hypothetical protein
VVCRLTGMKTKEHVMNGPVIVARGVVAEPLYAAVERMKSE